MAEKQFTVTESIEALGVDPKTFRRWLTKAGIDTKQQQGTIDERMRYLTETQLKGLAEAHGRTWPPQPRTTKPDQLPTTPGAFKQLVTNLVSAQVDPIEAEQSEQAEQIQGHSRLLADVIGRADRLERAAGATSETLSTLAISNAEQARRIETLEQARLADQERFTELERQLASQAAQIANLLEQIQAANRPRAAHRQKAAAVAGESGEAADHAGTQELAPGLVGAAEFAEAHGINVGTAKSAYQTGRIPTRRGKWRGPGRQPITVALDAEGRAVFYQLYSGHRDFKACQDCPHDQAGSPQG